MKKEIKKEKVLNLDKEVNLHNVYVYTKNGYKQLCLVETSVKKDYYCNPYIACKKFSFDTLEITEIELSNNEFNTYFKKSFELPEHILVNLSIQNDFLSEKLTSKELDTFLNNAEKLTVRDLINLQKELNLAYNKYKIKTKIDDLFM